MMSAYASPALAQETGLQQVDEFAGTWSRGLIGGIIRVINALLIIAAIAAVVYIIISGVRYFSSQGDEQAVRQAKLALVYGIVGVIIIVLSMVIVNYVISNITT